MIALQICVLAIGAIAIWSGPLSTPVFSTAARQQAPLEGGDNTVAEVMTQTDGPWGAGAARSLFEVKEYRLAMAQEWLESAQAATGAERIGRAEVAAQHARASLRSGPANGYAWLTLAWAEFFADRRVEAWEALRASWEWSPYAGNLFLARAILASQWWPELNDATRNRVMEELWVARLVQPEALERERARNERLDAIWRLVWARDRARRGVGFE